MQCLPFSLGRALTAFKRCQQSTRPLQSTDASSLNCCLVWRETYSSLASAAAGPGQCRGDAGSLAYPGTLPLPSMLWAAATLGPFTLSKAKKKKNAFNVPFYLKKLDLGRAKKGGSNKAKLVFSITLALLQKNQTLH